MHNQPLRPLDELETLRKQLKSYQESELRLYGDLSCLLKFIGVENTTGNPVFVGSPASIKTIIEHAKTDLDASSRLATQINIRNSAVHWNVTLPCAECKKETDHRVMLGNCYWDNESREYIYLLEGTFGYCYDCGTGWEEDNLTEEKYQQIVAEMKEYNKRQYKPIPLRGAANG